MLLSVSKELTLDLLQAPPSSKTRVIVGYSAWGPGQLDNELAESSWLMMDVDPALIFSVPAEQMWETAIPPASAQTRPDAAGQQYRAPEEVH